jgi:glutathione S-transferase
MKLYFVPNTRAHRPRWLLEELGVPYELVVLDPAKGETRTPEYLAVHPHGHVPALEDDGVVMFESAAICLYLADKFPDRGLAPAPTSRERAAYLQWIVYAVSEMEPPVALVHRHGGFSARVPPEQRIPAAVAEGREKFADACRVLAAHLAGREFMVGDRFTTADLMVGAVLGWARFQQMLDDAPELLAYLKRLTSRPAFKKARE